MRYDIFIFVKILNLQFLPKFGILWQNFEKIQFLVQKCLGNLTWNIVKIFGAATLNALQSYVRTTEIVKNETKMIKQKTLCN